MDYLRWLYRCALVGFLLLGGFGAFSSSPDSSTPSAVWQASNAIANAFQGGLLGLVVGVVFAIVLAVRRSRVRKPVVVPRYSSEPLPAPSRPAA